MTQGLFIPAMAVASCIGIGKEATVPKLLTGYANGLRPRDDLWPGHSITVGALPHEPAALPQGFGPFDCRNNRLLRTLADEIAPEIQDLIAQFGKDRIAVIIGTSTSGIHEGEAAVAHYQAQGTWPEGFDYRQQETGSAAAFIRAYLGLQGPAYVVATACSSSAKVFASARRLIRLGVVDAAIVGGADTLCQLTLAGFSALEAVSPGPCNPFSRNRNGITVGEGGALFILSPKPAAIALLGVGETSDAHHISAPDPQGQGAIRAMQAALADAKLTPSEIAGLNLHGTATLLNDAMESLAVHGVFGGEIPCSSTKGMTGHTLGAAGAVEAAFMWLTLHQGWNPDGLMPPHLWDGVTDPALPPLHLSQVGECLPAQERQAMLSNSFAFGGSNCSVIFGRGWA